MKKILFILLLPILCNAQSQVQKATDGALIYVPQMTSATPVSNNVLIHNGTAFVPSAPSALSVLTNYRVKDGSNNLDYNAAAARVRFTSTHVQPDLSISGTGGVTLGAYNTRALTTTFSAAQVVLSHGPSPFTATNRDWQILSEYDGTYSNLKFQHWNGSTYRQTFKNWGNGNITIGVAASADAGQMFQVNGNTSLGSLSSAVTAYILRLQASGGTSDIFRSTADPNGAITGSPSDLHISTFGTFGHLWGKYSGSATNSGWGKFLNLIDPNGASSGNVLGWNGTTWGPVAASSGGWLLAGNSVTAGTQFLGSTNNVSLRFRTNNIQRVLVDSTGNVGIANIAPTEKLDVTGNVKFSGALMPNNTAGTSGQVLTSAGAGTVPTWTTNTSESTSIGAFNNTGTSNGLSLSGTALSLHAATISTPGAVNTGQQTFTSGAGSKYFNGTGTAQISVDGNTDATEAGINFTQVGGADIMAQMQVNSSDVDNARFQLLLEDAGSYVPKLIIGSLNDQKGVQESGGLYEEVTNVTSSPYAVIYGDRNIYLDGATITVNLQAIGTSTGETKIGRVIYFFNDNATNVTITPNGSETIADAASLTLLPNTGVTLLAVTGTQWAIRD